MTVCIMPMPEKYRQIKPLYRPHHPPIFPNGEPTERDKQLARELWKLLDDESKSWYGTSF